MNSSVSPKDEICFLRVSHHVSTGLYEFHAAWSGCAYGHTKPDELRSEFAVVICAVGRGREVVSLVIECRTMGKSDVE